jgi:anti-sigma regulatory factor (Ser/Thr protein kinase)
MPGTDRAGDDDMWTLDLDRDQLPPLVQIRRWCRQVLTHLGDRHLDDVLLAAMELIANAYDHGGGPRRVRVGHSRRPCWVRVEVEDHSPERPVVRPGHLDQVRGRGLILVDRLADEWGVADRPVLGGKCVWAVIGCSGPARVACEPSAVTMTDAE